MRPAAVVRVVIHGGERESCHRMGGGGFGRKKKKKKSDEIDGR